jgi:hypothetical protein
MARLLQHTTIRNIKNNSVKFLINNLMRNILISVLFLSTLICCNNYPEVQNDWKNDNLKGNVKQFKQLSYRVNNVFGEIQKKERIEPYVDHIEPDFMKTYNINGFITFEYVLLQDNSLDYKYLFEYNDQNKLVCKTCSDDQDNVISKDIYEYNERGRKVKVTNYNFFGEIDNIKKYVYDKNDFVKKEFSIQSDGDTSFVTEYLNDNIGNPIEEVVYFPFDSSTFEKTVYEHGENNLLFKLKVYNSDGSIDRCYSYKYDDFGNSIEWVWSNGPQDDTPLKVTYEYKYDNYNNWIEKIHYWNEKPKYISERQIEYFE